MFVRALHENEPPFALKYVYLRSAITSFKQRNDVLSNRFVQPLDTLPIDIGQRSRNRRDIRYLSDANGGQDHGVVLVELHVTQSLESQNHMNHEQFKDLRQAVSRGIIVRSKAPGKGAIDLNI